MKSLYFSRFNYPLPACAINKAAKVTVDIKFLYWLKISKIIEYMI